MLHCCELFPEWEYAVASVVCLLMDSVCVCFVPWHALLAELDCMAASQIAIVAPWDSA
jgi:hypothetical protein